MAGADSEIVAWVSSQVIPFEAELRQKLRRVCKDGNELDDLVQEIYYRLLRLPSVDHIRDPRGFLFQMARNIVVDQMRRRAIVSIDTMHNIDEIGVFDTSPSPERVALARAELKWVLGLIASLPGRCRQVFKLRKIYGLSQAETARSLGITENVVEKETLRGLTLISDMVTRVGVTDGDALSNSSLGRKPLATLKGRHVKD
jgi:RNA polymerase sigma-70 factor (ECF subfamily)